MVPDARTCRTHLLSALTADLIGPFRLTDSPSAQELLPMAPSRFYHAGFLAPEAAREPLADPDKDEDETQVEQPAEEADDAEPEPKRPKLFPASMGLSVLLPAGCNRVFARVDFASYEPKAIDELPLELQARLEGNVTSAAQGEDDNSTAGAGRTRRSLPKKPWQRLPHMGEFFEVPLAAVTTRSGLMVPNAPGIILQARLAVAEAQGLPPGTQALSLFVINRRAPEATRAEQDRQFIFQVRLQLRCPEGIIPRPNLSGASGLDWDARVADLQFRKAVEYAVGHGVAVEVLPNEGEAHESESAHNTAQPLVTTVGTTFLPRYEVPRVKPRSADDGVCTQMGLLAELASADDVQRALSSLPTAYQAWLERQQAIDVSEGLSGESAEIRKQTQRQLLKQADQSRARIAEGIELLQRDPILRTAFALANRAMDLQARKRKPEAYAERNPSWRLFQLAFVLLCLPSLADGQHPHREDVELVFFPTGGGKTEAYLGVIAFLLVLRRMQGAERPDGGLGVTVILRYTLRLLTLDQLDRAATLICALEHLRSQHDQGATELPDLGKERFSIGLWVGGAATANRLDQASKQVSDHREGRGASPCPLTQCPWCRTPLTPQSFDMRPNPKQPEWLRSACPDFRCEFSAGQNPLGLPLVYVDEQVYQELPCFILATVDKFATLPYRGQAGKLFGKVLAQASSNGGGASKGKATQTHLPGSAPTTPPHFLGPADGRVPSGSRRLPEGLLPPELIVQDELHLISGPLGTMVGLYETAIDLLCTRKLPDGSAIRPKILASTATVRRADQQIAALYGRAPYQTRLFPPPGIDDGETFFAEVDHHNAGRLYVGIAAAGRAMKASCLRTYVSVLAAANHLLDKQGPPDQPADHFMTVAGYFNSLRELGGMRRLVEDDARQRALGATDRASLDSLGPHPFLKNRQLALEPLELTSRETTAAITESKARLSTPYLLQKEPCDVLLASNMISVGVDIDRLGVMVIAGQPKTTAEYIQASSRVGRPTSAAGLVLTCLNPAKARDRSHYERFIAFHQCFYRYVEATSVTPFAMPALDRGLCGSLVSMARFMVDALSGDEQVHLLGEYRGQVQAAVEALCERAGNQAQLGHAALTHGEDTQRLAELVKDRAENLLDTWQVRARRAKEDGQPLVYSRPKRSSKRDPLLRDPLDRGELNPQDEADAAALKFLAPHSMRDVEPSVPLWVNEKMTRY